MNDLDWRQRLERAVAETLRRRAARAALRRDLDSRRQAGLAARHRQKLARKEDAMPNLPPCCDQVDEPPCDQHRQAARVVRYQGIRTHGRASAIVGDPGKARPVEPSREDRP